MVRTDPITIVLVYTFRATHFVQHNDLDTAKWRSPLWESNPRPFPYHGNALPTELRGRDSEARAGL